MNKIFSLYILSVFFMSACAPRQKLDVIPQPAEVEFGRGKFDINQEVTLQFDQTNDELLPIVALITKNINFGMVGKEKNTVSIKINPKMNLDAEGYVIDISEHEIKLEAKTNVGLFYGAQTLVQMTFGKTKIPCVKINDYPRFKYRGMHLDVSRHFFPKEFIFKYIDLLAMYKFNIFHWHFTDGAAWRIEVKKYPKLTGITAWRPKKKLQEWWKGDRKFSNPTDTARYGGFYTQDDVRKIVGYAKNKHITIIPEIEMPGHSEEVCAVYPELSCSGKPYVNHEFCIGNEKTFEFLENVLNEIIELFPSKYIHIGGDECSTKSWENCPKCKKRMKEEKFTSFNQLQGYMINRISNFLSAKGREIIAWNEVLDDSITIKPTIMLWRDINLGIKAAQNNYKVIMSPSKYLYFDYYQGNPAKQLESIGGMSTLRNVYAYEPIPDSLTKEQAKNIIGVQANLWTEFVPTPERAEYMLLPRLLALSEIAWSPKNKKNWTDFRRRVDKHFEMLTVQGYNYCPPLNEITIEENVNYKKKNITVTLNTEEYLPEIRYTTNGTVPTAYSKIYTKPFAVEDSADVCATIFEKGQRVGDVEKKSINYHKAIGKKIVYASTYDYVRYPAGGNNALIDGYRGGFAYSDKRWQGFLKNLDVTIDLGKQTKISKISVCFMQLTFPGIYIPDYVEFYISTDGVKFEKIKTIENNISTTETKLTFKDFICKFAKTKARYVRVFAKNHEGYMFTDEIIIW